MKHRLLLAIVAAGLLGSSPAIAEQVPPTWTVPSGATSDITFVWTSWLYTSTLLDFYRLEPAGDDQAAQTRPLTDKCIENEAPQGTLLSVQRWCAIKDKTATGPVTLKREPLPNPARVAITQLQYDQLPDTIVLARGPAEWRIESKPITSLDTLQKSLEWITKLPQPIPNTTTPSLPGDVKERPELLHDNIGLRVVFPARVMPETADLDDYVPRIGQGIWAYRMAHLVARLNLETAIQYARQLPATLRMWSGPLHGHDVERLALLVAKTPLDKLRYELNEDPFDSLWVRLKVVSATHLAIEFGRVHRDWRMTKNVVTLLTEWDNEAYLPWHDAIEEFAGLPERGEYDEVFRKPSLMEWMGRAINVAGSAAFIAGSAVGIPGGFVEGATVLAQAAAVTFMIGSSLGGLGHLTDPTEGLPPGDPEFDSRLEQVGYWAARIAQLANPFRRLTRRLYNYAMVPLHQDLSGEWTALFQDNLTNLLDPKLNPNVPPGKDAPAEEQAEYKRRQFQRPRFDKQKGTWMLLTRWSLPFFKWERFVNKDDHAAAKKAFAARRDDLRNGWAPKSRKKKVAQVLLPTGLLRKVWKTALVQRHTYQDTIEEDIAAFFEDNKEYFFPAYGTKGVPIAAATRKIGISLSTFGVVNDEGNWVMEKAPMQETPLW